MFGQRLPLLSLTVGLALAGTALMARAQHAHINAGATAPTAGSPLYFANGSSFEAASGYVIHLTANSTTAYGPLYLGGADVTFTSLPRTLDFGGPDPAAALAGTQVAMIVESVTGPAGGALSFWDSFDGFFPATEITFTVPVGTVHGIRQFILSENDGSAGADPYGHIHGRKFSADRPGLYTAGIRLVDLARNGAGPGPLHAPSATTYFNFQAGTTISRLTLTNGVATLTFGTQAGANYFVEATAAPGPDANWHAVAGPIAGTDRLVEVGQVPVGAAATFFRLRVE